MPGDEVFIGDYPPTINDGNSYPSGLLLDRGQAQPAPFLPGFNVGLCSDASAAIATQHTPSALPPAAQQQQLLPAIFSCTQLGCTKTFKRDSDRIRHENTVHRARQGLHLCPVAVCPKSHGAGFSRADKVTEHLWKKHANLGYAKRVL
jgi:hypothetical protein